MARTIATGMIDIQLMGLPDVKRQLENVPRLMDGVARATINFTGQMRRAQVSAAGDARRASQKRLDMLQQEIDRYKEWLAVQNQTHPSVRSPAQNLRMARTRRQMEEKQGQFAGMPDPRQVGRQFAAAERSGQFNLSAVGGLKQFREATLGTQTLATLKEEEAALGRLAAQIDMTDASNRAFIAGERERIRLSREAVNLESQRVLNPQQFAIDRRKESARQQVTQDLGEFEEKTTHKAAIQGLKDREEALRGLKDETGTMTAVQAAFVDSSLEQAGVQRRLLESLSQHGQTLNALRQKRQILLSMSKPEMKATAGYTRALSQLDRQIAVTSRQYANAGRKLGSFNQKLHEFGQGSRAANYRMQQLSFGAQDAFQVWGQTGFAGALHASANNLSMFVQTLDIASPKMLAFAAFGVTAGMMMLSNWLVSSKKEADSLATSFERFLTTMDRAFAREDLVKSAMASGPKELADAYIKASLEAERSAQKIARHNRELVELQEQNRDAFFRTGTTMQLEGPTREARKEIFQGASIDVARERFIERGLETVFLAVESEARRRMRLGEQFDVRVGRTREEVAATTYRDAGQSKADAESKAKSYIESSLAADESLRDQARLLTEMNNELETILARNVGKEYYSAFREMDEINRSFRQGQGGKGVPDALRQAAVDEAARGIKPQGMSSLETLNADYRGAMLRTISNMNEAAMGSRERGATESAVAEQNAGYMIVIRELQKKIADRTRAIDDLIRDVGRTFQSDATGIDLIKQQQEDKRRQALRRIADSETLSAIQKRNLTADVNTQGQQREAEAIQEYVDNLLKSIQREAAWNDTIAQRRMALADAYNKRTKEIAESGLSQAEKFQMQSTAARTRQQQSRQIDFDEARAKRKSEFLGRDGGDPLVDQLLASADKTNQVLEEIAMDPNLSAADKKTRSEMAAESRKYRDIGIREQFNKVGMTDPKSLHKQIQMSLRGKTYSEKVLADQLEEQKKTNRHFTDLLANQGIVVGP